MIGDYSSKVKIGTNFVSMYVIDIVVVPSFELFVLVSRYRIF